MIVTAFAVLALCVAETPASAGPAVADCATALVKPVGTLATLPTKDGPAVTPAGVLQLSKTLYLQVTGLPDLIAENECRKKQTQPVRKLVLFLNGLSMKGLAYGIPDSLEKNILSFRLDRTSENKAAWAQILASPSNTPRDVKVSIGPEDQYPFESDVAIKFRSLPDDYLALGALFLLGLLGVFIYLVCYTGICREGAPRIPDGVSDAQKFAPSSSGPFSLSKLQAALWFFVILASYMLIAAVTFDINGTLNATALTLLGIGAATVVGAAAIQNNSQGGGAETAADPADVAKQLDTRINELKQSIKPNLAAADAKRLREALEEAKLAYKRATNQSTGWFRDILSDANGVNFHRFQMVAWTIVLGFIFIEAVLARLAMPDFDNTLLALQGLSAGTYLGLKITEPKTPDVPPAPKKAG